jgi:hypothetical protein
MATLENSIEAYKRSCTLKVEMIEVQLAKHVGKGLGAMNASTISSVT